MKYSIKYWKDKTDYNKGNAVFLQDNYSLKDTEIVIDAIKNLVYAYEIFETKSGETYYHSRE